MKFKKQKPEQPLRRRPSSGSAMPPTFSYYSRRSSAPSLDRQTHRQDMAPQRSRGQLLQYILQRFGVVISVLAMVILLITSLQVSSTPKVVILNSSKSYQLHSLETYQAATEQLLKRSWTNSNKLTINTGRITADLRTQYPEVADASMTLPLIGQRPVMYLRMTEPRLILSTTQGQAYVLDENGRALSPVSQVANIDHFRLPTVLDQSGLDVRLGHIVLSRGSVQFISEVISQLQARDQSIGQLVLVQGSEEFDVHLMGKAYYGKFNLHESDTARQQAGSFLAVQSSLAKQGKAPSEYIDVRIPGRAYYK